MGIGVTISLSTRKAGFVSNNFCLRCVVFSRCSVCSNAHFNEANGLICGLCFSRRYRRRSEVFVRAPIFGLETKKKCRAGPRSWIESGLNSVPPGTSRSIRSRLVQIDDRTFVGLSLFNQLLICMLGTVQRRL